MSIKYNQIVEFIDKCTNMQELNAARAQVNNYRIQSGGQSTQLKYEIDTLMVEINNKEKELLKRWM